MKVFKYSAVLLLVISLWGCDKVINGSGEIIETTVEVPNFQNLQMVGSIDAEISSGNAFKVKIVGDDNLTEYVESKVKEGTLRVNFRKNVRIKNSHVKVVVTTPFLNKIESEGSGDITSDSLLANNRQMELKSAGSGNMKLQLNAPAIKVNGAGAGNFVLSGQTKDLECSIAGSGDVNSMDLKAENAKIKIAGSGNVKVFASVNLSANIAGSGNIVYYGNPSLSEVKVAGTGTVKGGE